MAASFSNAHEFGVPGEAAVPAVAAALNDIGATEIRWAHDQSSVTAKLGINWLSWGECLTVMVAADGRVSVRSECVFPLQIADWGKNRQNCHAFLTAVSSRIMAMAAQQSRPGPPPLPQTTPTSEH